MVEDDLIEVLMVVDVFSFIKRVFMTYIFDLILITIQNTIQYIIDRLVYILDLNLYLYIYIYISMYVYMDLI